MSHAARSSSCWHTPALSRCSSSASGLAAWRSCAHLSSYRPDWRHSSSARSSPLGTIPPACSSRSRCVRIPSEPQIALTQVQILLITGFVILCEPLVTLTYHHVVRALKPDSPRALWLYRGAVLLQLALIASVVLGIPVGLIVNPENFTCADPTILQAGAQFDNLSSSSSTLATIRTCR